MESKQERILNQLAEFPEGTDLFVAFLYLWYQEEEDDCHVKNQNEETA